MPEHLILHDCSARLERRTILSDVSLELASPGLHCLIGSNGAGKTTLLRLICGLLEQVSGEVSFRETDLLRIRAAQRASLLSYVPQIADAGVALSVYEALEVARMANPASQVDPESILRRLNLRELAARPLSRLSGGELKRAMLAQALVQDTPLMLLDEPTAHLDPPARVEVLQLLQEIARQDRKLVLCSLHYPDLAAQYADSVILLREGRIMASGDPLEMTGAEMLAELYAGSTDRLEAAS